MPDDPTTTAALCHCGRPATDTEHAPNMGDYCDECSLARCDIISAVDCPHYQPTTAATEHAEAWLAAICACRNKAGRHACHMAAEVMADETGRSPDDYDRKLLGVTRGL